MNQLVVLTLDKSVIVVDLNKEQKISQFKGSDETLNDFLVQEDWVYTFGFSSTFNAFNLVNKEKKEFLGNSSVLTCA